MTVVVSWWHVMWGGPEKTAGGFTVLVDIHFGSLYGLDILMDGVGEMGRVYTGHCRGLGLHT